MKKKLKVLVVEDTPADRLFLEEALKRTGFIVRTANCGKAALKVLEKERFNLYIIDMRMPGMDGMSLIHIIRRMEILEPIIINTSLDPTTIDVIGARLNNVSVFMQKTWNEDTLQKAINLSLDLRGVSGVVFLKSFSDDIVRCLIPVKIGEKHGFFDFVTIRKDKSVCLSCQTGCQMGCRFCMTGQRLNLCVRNLSFEQMYLGYRIAQILHGRGQPIEVLMEGMGEPLLNKEAIETLSERIDSGDTLRYSTMVPHITLLKNFLEMIRGNSRVRDKVKQIQCSLQLPNDILRWKHMPATRKTTIREILRLLEEFFQETGIEVCLNYAVFSDINDSPENIAELIRLLEDFQHLTLRLSVANPLGIYQPVSMERMHAIRSEIIGSGVDETRIKDIFVSSGGEIKAACGQLANSFGGSVVCEYGAVFEMD